MQYTEPQLMQMPSNLARMARRGLKTAAELSANRPHGDRLKYLGGCRCDQCRAANSAYQCQRDRLKKQGEWNGYVPADKARAHMAMLASKGIGRRTVSEVSGVAESVLHLVNNGQRPKVRALTERAILAVTPAALNDGHRVDAGPSLKLLQELLEVGYTKAALALELGYSRGALQFQKTVTMRNAHRIERLHARLRHVPAEPTLRRLRELRQEGYLPNALLTLLRKRAAELGMDGPDLTVRCGQVKASDERLVRLVRDELLGEERA